MSPTNDDNVIYDSESACLNDLVKCFEQELLEV